VQLPSPTRVTQHEEPLSYVQAWLIAYVEMHAEAQYLPSPTIRLDPENRPEPDALLRRRVGASRVDPEDYLSGPPELVVEIAASSASIDLGPKMRAYRRNGVLEYLVWSIYENRLDWFTLVDGDYVPRTPDAKGIIESTVFPGLRLDVPALLARDMPRVLRTQRAKLRRRS
jgi:Uma2 family endonuclease